MAPPALTVSVLSADRPLIDVCWLVIEAVFQIPGLGRHFIKAIETDDINVIMGIVLLYGSLIVLGNMASDFLIGWLNPRARSTS